MKEIALITFHHIRSCQNLKNNNNNFQTQVELKLMAWFNSSNRLIKWHVKIKYEPCIQIRYPSSLLKWERKFGLGDTVADQWWHLRTSNEVTHRVHATLHHSGHWHQPRETAGYVAHENIDVASIRLFISLIRFSLAAHVVTHLLRHMHAHYDP